MSCLKPRIGLRLATQFSVQTRRNAKSGESGFSHPNGCFYIIILLALVLGVVSSVTKHMLHGGFSPGTSFASGICVTVLLFISPILGFRFSERRKRKRQESWKCPQCGGAFGPQKTDRYWMRKSSLQPSNGPIMSCPACSRDFKLDKNGEEVDVPTAVIY